jgi:hypothetical protein
MESKKIKINRVSEQNKVLKIIIMIKVRKESRQKENLVVRVINELW